MIKFKSVHYLLLLILILLLSMVYLNMFLDYNVSSTELNSYKTGALSAIPQTALPAHYVFSITLSVIVFGYFLWVWVESDKLKDKYKK